MLVLGVAAHLAQIGPEARLGPAQYRGGGGNGYMYTVHGGENLFVDSTATGARHGFSINDAAAGNVFRDVRVNDGRYSDDSHRFLAHANLYDRVVLGHVVDFILVHWQNRWYFPAFNLADSAITIGAVMLALDMFKAKKSGEPAHD